MKQVIYRAYKQTSHFRGSCAIELTQSTSKCNQSHFPPNGLIRWESNLWKSANSAGCKPFSQLIKSIIVIGALQASFNVYMHIRQF